MNPAVVFNVQRFSVHDGPGIRTTVFLKGCPLSCPWCHNPESRDPRPELALRQERCLGCGRCLPACPENLAAPLGAAAGVPAPSAASGSACRRCGACAAACPTGARDLLGEHMDLAGVLAAVESDRPYHEESGGGVTFSGGEPLAAVHAPFLLACLDACGRRGVHRAVDTCGHVATDHLLAAAARAELLLFDLKIMDDARHRRTVGVGNGLIHENLQAVTARGHEVWLRVPLIPGLTDDEDNLTAVARFAAGLPRPCPVHLLPYHGLAGPKYGRLGLDDPLARVAPAEPAAVEEKAALMRSFGLEVHIGG